MADPKLTIGMVYTSASKSSSTIPSPPPLARSHKPPAPTSMKSQTNKENGSEKNDNGEDFLASLCAPGSDNIILEYVTPEGRGSDQLVSPSGEVIYRLLFEVNKNDGEVHRNSNGQLVGAWTEHNLQSEKLKFQFAWHGGKWGFNPNEEVWLSNVGTLPKHEFMWMDFRDKSDADISRNMYGTDGDDDNVRCSVMCIDKSDPGKRTVCAVAMDTYDHGTLSIPKDIIATSNQLDEMVTVSLAVMDRLRDEIKDDVANNRQATRSSMR